MKQPPPIPEPIRKMDVVLWFLGINSLAKDGIEFDELLDCVNLLLKEEKPTIPAIDRNELWHILEKLRKDGLENEIASKHEATYEGRLEAHLGGYTRKYLQSHQLVLSKTRQDRREARLYWINFWIALAAVIAAIYYLTKLYWEHGWFQSWFPVCGGK